MSESTPASPLTPDPTTSPDEVYDLSLGALRRFEEAGEDSKLRKGVRLLANMYGPDRVPFKYLSILNEPDPMESLLISTVDGAVYRYDEMRLVTVPKEVAERLRSSPTDERKDFATQYGAVLA